MMKLLFVAALLLLPLPVSALTWKEVWTAVSDTSYATPYVKRNRRVVCHRHEYWEEYVQGSGRYSGYVREHHKKTTIPCYGLH